MVDIDWRTRNDGKNFPKYSQTYLIVSIPVTGLKLISVTSNSKGIETSFMYSSSGSGQNPKNSILHTAIFIMVGSCSVFCCLRVDK